MNASFLHFLWRSPHFFTARRYASAVLAVVVCLSVTSRYCIETTGRIELVLARRLPSTYPTLSINQSINHAF